MDNTIQEDEVGLADAIASQKDELRSPPKCKCTIAKILGFLDSEDLAAFVDMLNDPRISGTDMSKWLNNYGKTVLEEAAERPAGERERLEYEGDIFSRIGSDAIQRYRRGVCSCTSEGTA